MDIISSKSQSKDLNLSKNRKERYSKTRSFTKTYNKTLAWENSDLFEIIENELFNFANFMNNIYYIKIKVKDIYIGLRGHSGSLNISYCSNKKYSPINNFIPGSINSNNIIKFKNEESFIEGLKIKNTLKIKNSNLIQLIKVLKDINQKNKYA